MPKKLTREEFIEKAILIHGDRYDYSKVVYVNSKKHVCIICKIHGEFYQLPNNHLNGNNCTKCGHNVPTTEMFSDKANEIHKNKYDYSKVKYVDKNTPVIIICSEHGEFLQKPEDHLKGFGCPNCTKTNSLALNFNEFIEKSIKIHNNKYDYSKVTYINSTTEICIICPEHGEFWQLPANHSFGHGCPKCANGVLTTESFILKSKIIYGNKYDYSKVIYVDNKTPVIINCPIHGDFKQKPKKHLDGLGCIKCKNSKTSDEFIEQSRLIHGEKYIYSKTEYINWNLKVYIICPVHGEFWQLPNSHLRGGGCPKCAGEIVGNALRFTNEKFITKAKLIHGNKYDYSKVEYVDRHTTVIITCLKHGDFTQTPEVHLKGCGCSECNKMETTEYVKKLKNARWEKYDYSKVNYVNSSTKICIICQIHGEFWQIPSSHLRGSNCPECASKNDISEQKLLSIIRDNFQNYNLVYQFRDKWLRAQSIDMYLTEYDIAIEYHGRQHFDENNCWGGAKGFSEVRERDIRKNNLCKKNNVNLLYFTYENPKYIIDYIDKVYIDEQELINKINDIIKLKENAKNN